VSTPPQCNLALPCTQSSPSDPVTSKYTLQIICTDDGNAIVGQAPVGIAVWGQATNASQSPEGGNTSHGVGVGGSSAYGYGAQFNCGYGYGVTAAGGRENAGTTTPDGIVLSLPGVGVGASGYVGVQALDPADTAPPVNGPTGLQASGAYAGVQAISQGGTAGIFSSAAAPGEANANPAVDASTTSTGPAAYVHVDNADSTAAALDAVTQGTGPAAFVHSDLIFLRRADVPGPSPALVVEGPQIEVIEFPGGPAFASGPAASFTGSVDVTGDFTATAKSFVIDHPLDPAGKYLAHVSVESSEQANLYSGNVVLDDNGEAVVSLPAWAEAINEDFRYQLTCVGRAAPVYVADEVAGNEFRIAGGVAGLKVSWQLTGIRKDAWAKAHPLVVEQDKPEADQGYFRHPELFGSDQQHSIAHRHRIASAVPPK
jgi:hypothetical protein